MFFLFKIWADGVVYCTCGTCLIPTDKTRLLTKEKFDFLSIPYFVKRKGSYRGARHCKNDDQREYHQAKVSFRKATSDNFNSVLERFQKQDACRESQIAIEWTQDICKQLDQKANEERSVSATKSNAQGLVSPRSKGEDYLDAAKDNQELATAR